MRTKRAIRPDTFDRLESREVLSTAGLTQHVANPAQVFLPQTPITNPHQAFLNGGGRQTAGDPSQAYLPKTTITGPHQGYLNGLYPSNPNGPAHRTGQTYGGLPGGGLFGSGGGGNGGHFFV